MAQTCGSTSMARLWPNYHPSRRVPLPPHHPAAGFTAQTPDSDSVHSPALKAHNSGM
ncbi:hypothetical protein L226DRAFT_534548 [Lentinus tigrinus ALCF2SS1-7]|uniref:uncharacterized protein n=1 Tax=Lentinus tigrinus ALCF2SS1-7 TaxID=1328758 RepID=UPI0011663D75|nr:hypothetical protein L226DRAFT_534548 [Lentinus tigrinus ALCF2SS1-7]